VINVGARGLRNEPSVPFVPSAQLDRYRAFLREKVDFASGNDHEQVAIGDVHPIAKPHQRAIVRWAVAGGRRAIFARFGLGKTIMQLETMRLTLAHAGGIGLIIAPLGVRQEFRIDAEKLGQPLTFVRTTDEMREPGLYLTNYESVRERKIDCSKLTAVSLDEASVLRGFGGTKTFREFMARIAGDDRENGVQTPGVPYRFVATATPAPNEYIELLCYAAFLGVMDVGEAKTRFFKRNSEKADQLTLHPHKEEEFWLWVNTWAVLLQRPSDLGFPDEGYDLPPISVRWHEVPDSGRDVGTERDGQGRLLASESMGLQEEAAARRSSMSARIAKVRELVDEAPDKHVIIWHDLEDERRAIEASVPDVVSVYGSQDLDEREESIIAFADGRIARIAAKPVMLGSGCNFQRHCARAIFAGPGFKFNDFIQAVHRIYRFLQPHEVEIHIVHAESQRPVVRTLQRKWARHDELTERMSAIIREYGLNSTIVQEKLARSIGATRQAETGPEWTAVNNDCVEETMAMPEASVGLIVTSIPFGTQYEYTPSYNDFGHTDDDDHFFRQMDFLTPELLRVLQGGRMLCVHVKDRARPGGLDNRGLQSMNPFVARTVLHYFNHGFAYMGMITVATDVVRENAQTYRLGWSMQCDDGSRMGVGMPEYVLLFRKPPSDPTNGYADTPVAKTKDEYSRARWQIDAHAVWRSNGDRILVANDLLGLEAHQIYRLFRAYNVGTVYDYEQHVAIGEALDAARRLPPSFSLIPVAADTSHEGVWTDVTRMRTLNGAQHAKGKEMHLCPLQFDIVDRLITRYSNAGDVVYDPFGGLMTVPLEAVKLGRRGLGCELSPAYFADGVWHLRAQDARNATLSLFDLTSEEIIEELAGVDG
jgi:hypothetical protein